jgi:hypothetical protein
VSRPHRNKFLKQAVSVQGHHSSHSKIREPRRQIYWEKRSVTATNCKILGVLLEDSQEVPTYRTAKFGYREYMSFPILSKASDIYMIMNGEGDVIPHPTSPEILPLDAVPCK